MGRKIPGRKHRGVRDPEKQAAIRFNNVKDKINAPPSNPDDQQIPRSLQRIIELKNKVKSGDFTKKFKKTKIKEKNENVPESFIKKLKGKPEKIIPVFKQNSGETDRAFINRVNRICMDVTRESKFEEKYGVDVKRNEHGEVEEVVKRPKDELEILIKKARQEKKDKKNTKKMKKNKTENKNEGPRLTKSQKWSLKKKLKKMKKKSQTTDDFQQYKDEVKFGETVHAPPTLVTPRRVEKSQNAPRPGRKALLLKSVLQPDTSRSQKLTSQSDTKLHKIVNTAINRKGKRKDLPHAMRRQLEKQQKEVISAYKELKAKKYEDK